MRKTKNNNNNKRREEFQPTGDRAMACRAVEIWTLSSLVGAFLDLTLAHLLLVGATIAFFASKLLSLFGLSLPCTCDGHFGHPACSQTALLLDFPADRVASVRRSLLSRFPFDSFLLDGATSSQRCRYADGGGGSYCSASSLSRPSRPSRSLSLPAPDPPSAQSKSVRLGHMPPSLRRRRTLPRLGDSLPGLEKSPSVSVERISGGPRDFDDEDVEGLAEESAAGEKKDSCSGIGCNEGERLTKMSSLERDLKKERGARVALHLELEQERSAAATAADEAMAVMLRLQKEKAEIEMEARQYQRMIEEKSAYDEEEMDILKEIIVRREREKHFLEKEVEMYKQMMDSQERVEQEVDSDHTFLQENLNTLNDFPDNPVLMLEQIYKSIGKKEVANCFRAESSPTLNSNGSCSKLGHPIQKFVDGRKHIEFLNTGDECYQEFQEKNILASQINQSSSNILNSRCGEDSIMYNARALCAAEYHKDIADLTVRDEGERVALIEIGVPVNGLCRMESNDVDQRGSESSRLETESSIHDVHVINDGQVLKVEGTVKHTTNLSRESSCANLDEIKVNIRRSCSEITNRISLVNSSPGRTCFDLRRNSLPSVESERYKLESEVELLRKRLENIRQGREKLNLSADHKEKETFQLQLLDEIAFQLKEIKKVMKPAKSIRRSSLSTPSSEFKGHST